MEKRSCYPQLGLLLLRSWRRVEVVSDAGTMNKPIKTQCTPADIFANIPGLLGFYPQDSFVVAFFLPNHQQGYKLGPLVRVDITDTESFDDVFLGVPCRGQEMIVFVYAVVGHRGSLEVIQYLQQLTAAATRHGVFLEAAWATQRIQAGEPYELLFGPAAKDLGANTTGLECWELGAIAPPMTSIALQKLVAGGELPEMDREATFTYFDPQENYADQDTVARWRRAGTSQGEELVFGIQQPSIDGRRTFTVAVESFMSLLDRIETRKLSVDTVAADDECMEFAAAYWSQVLLRDATFIALGQGHASALSILALAAARVYSGVIRANALCVFAAATLASDVWVRAVPAMRVALEEVPGHRLAFLMSSALAQGCCRKTVESCIQAAEYLARRYGEEIPDAA